MNGYPKLFLPLLMLIVTTLFISGLLLIPSFLTFRVQWDVEWLMESVLSSGDLRSWSTTIHAITGWIMIWIIGSLWSLHMRSHWRRNENRRNGLVFSVYWVLLLATSLGIYYFGDEFYSEYSSIIHVLLGLGLPIIFGLHYRHGKQALAKRNQTNGVVQPASLK